jgi:hypothetical protein
MNLANQSVPTTSSRIRPVKRRKWLQKVDALLVQRYRNEIDVLQHFDVAGFAQLVLGASLGDVPGASPRHHSGGRRSASSFQEPALLRRRMTACHGKLFLAIEDRANAIGARVSLVRPSPSAVSQISR